MQQQACSVYLDTVLAIFGVLPSSSTPERSRTLYAYRTGVLLQWNHQRRSNGLRRVTVAMLAAFARMEYA